MNVFKSLNILAVITTTALVLLSAEVGSAKAGAAPKNIQPNASVRPGCGTNSQTIQDMQKQIAALPVGDRIAYWAESFIGTPYDPDPMGVYVSTKKVVCDNEVDCMYLVFRSAELGTSDTPEEASGRALSLRFLTKGVISDGEVTNYDERFAYAEDMIASGRWGRDVTSELGDTMEIEGSRGRDRITIIKKDELMKPKSLGRLMSGDVIFFVKDPSRRVVGEVIGHLGIIKLDGSAPMLIHASGTKKNKTRPGGGVVKKIALREYLADTGFIGVQVTRFE